MSTPTAPDAAPVGAGAVGTGPAGRVRRRAAVRTSRRAGDRPATAGPPPWRPPLLWRALLVTSRLVLAPFCRLRVTGPPLPSPPRPGTPAPGAAPPLTAPPGRGHAAGAPAPGDAAGRGAGGRRGTGPVGGGPVILAANHIGSLDPVVLMAACRARRIAPRIMATGGLFRAPVLGAVMRHCGQVRVDRRRAEVVGALPAARAVLEQGSVLLAYPEGRITLDPGMWPERGRSGLARLARDTGVPVVPVSQWGAHLLVPWGAPWGAVRRLLWALVHRPVVRVHFGAPVDLTGLRVPAATDRIMEAITENLGALRPDEPRLPAWIDPVRPVSTARSRRRPPG